MERVHLEDVVVLSVISLAAVRTKLETLLGCVHHW